VISIIIYILSVETSGIVRGVRTGREDHQEGGTSA
jgi:hypothetical protein